MQQPWGIHWFRRDLRISANAALRYNWQQVQGRTLGLFCFDATFLKRPDFSHNRFAFFLQSLKVLRAELAAQGGDLLVIDGRLQQALPVLMAYCQRQGIAKPRLLTFNRDYEPFARQRDGEIAQLCLDNGLEVHTERDHVLIEPHELLKADQSPYQVYSPFARAWFDLVHTPAGESRVGAAKPAATYLQQLAQQALPPNFRMAWTEVRQAGDFPWPDALDSFVAANQPHVTIPIPKAGFAVAHGQLTEFASRLQRYKDDRDFPDRPGTSKLSMYLKNGSLTPWHILHALGVLPIGWREQGGANQFVKEIAWREFYYAILWHRPDVEQQSFLPQFRQLAWSNNKAWFERWQEGTTGFPIVDAGMRQLRQTGWMHNRVRMIVASFLTKDLLINWQWGERWFMQQLLDGDLAANNGGWQWAASTGCDPQPYFRIFNPWLQSAKFDPEGHYIKQFVPELVTIASPALHDARADRSTAGYPAPMVDHAVQRELALAMYQAAKTAN